MTGELSASVIVNTVTNWATVETEWPKSTAILGNSGAIMKPSVPIANVPNAMQSIGINSWRVADRLFFSERFETLAELEFAGASDFDVQTD
jgi:hypothetical protein